ncbi:MAG: M23 family metallopeptidase, partial [Chitinophagales bacterium]
MKKMLFFIGLVSAFFANAQEEYPQDYFSSPVDFTIYLSGTFGEPRTTHFHAGLDIKTQGVEGKNIYAVADGYVSRIKVSPWGYGNALYITHPNGYTTVYAHLQKFDEAIATYVKEQQYALTESEVNLDSLPSDLFVFAKGDIIAKSGNSGSSFGPHLHFEIRDSLEQPHNPMLFGFDKIIKDDVKPAISNLIVYNQTTDRYATDSKQISLAGSNGAYSLSNTLIVNRDEIGFGIHAIDQLSGVSNKNGLNHIELYMDDDLLYEYEMDKFAFTEGKYVYTHCDYWKKRKDKQTVHRCFVQKGNQLRTYPTTTNDGIVYLFDNEKHQVKIIARDFHGNESVLSFLIQKDESSSFFTAKEDDYIDIFEAGTRNHFRNDNVQIDMSAEVLFDDLYLEYHEEDRNQLTDMFHIHNHETPVFTYFNLKLKPNEIDSAKSDKYIIVHKNYKDKYIAMGGEIDGDFVSTKTRTLGRYYVSIDTIAPKISPVNISEGKTMTWQKYVQVKATDNLSGIAEYNAFLNGEWVLLTLDGK